MARGVNFYQPLRDLEENQRGRAPEPEEVRATVSPDLAYEAAGSAPAMSEEQRQTSVLRELAERSAATREHSQGGNLRADLELMAERDQRAWAEEHRAMFPEGEEHDPDAREQHIQFGEQRQEAIYRPEPYLQETEQQDAQAQDAESPASSVEPSLDVPPAEIDTAQDIDQTPDEGSASEPDEIAEPEPSVSDYQGWDQPEEPSQVSSVDLDAARRDGVSADDYHGWAPSEQGQDQGHEL